MKKETLLILTLTLLFISGCSKEDLFFEPDITNSSISSQINNIDLNSTNITNNEINASNESESTQTCIDSDGGKVYEEKGFISVSNGKLRQAADSCENSGVLIEYYCKDDLTLGIEIFECFSIEKVCIDGACTGINSTQENETNDSNNT